MPSYEVHGDGPYFIFDKKSQKMVSMISFTTSGEAEAFIEKLNRTEPIEEKETPNE